MILSGASFNPSLTATIFPLTGEKMSETAFTDSTTENRFRIEQQVIGAVVKSLGGIARPAAIYFPQALPKTRSGKILRRAIRALAEGNKTGDMSTLDNPTAIDAIKQSMKDY